jgi:excisionase family DNA binding protein
MNAITSAPIESLLTFPQAAKVLGISVRQFYRVVADGKMPVIMVSKRSPRVHPDALRRYLESCTVHPGQSIP